MNFPWLPILSFVPIGPNDNFYNFWVSVLLAGACVVWALYVFVKSAVKGKYTLSQASAGFVLLTAAAVVATFGIYNICVVFVLVVVAAIAISVIWWFITFVIWEFLCKFILWRVLAKNLWIAVNGEEPITTEQKQEKPEKPKKPKKLKKKTNGRRTGMQN